MYDGGAPQAASGMTVAASVSTSNDQAPFTLELPPDLIVHEPDELRQELLGALASGGSVVLDARETHRVGIVGLQLLLAFLREAHQKGMPVKLTGARHELREALRSTGLDLVPDFVRAQA
jgi:anti-anti-sigma regulatory factor